MAQNLRYFLGSFEDDCQALNGLVHFEGLRLETLGVQPGGLTHGTVLHKFEAKANTPTRILNPGTTQPTQPVSLMGFCS